MLLQDFPLTVGVDPVVVLQQARSYEQVRGELVSGGVFSNKLAELGLREVIQEASETKGHIARNICLSVIDGIRAKIDFEFIENTLVGASNIAMLDYLKSVMPDNAYQLDLFKAFVIAECNKIEKPFEFATLHNLLIAHNVCPTIDNCTSISGYFVIENTADCERHSPNLYGQNPRTLRWQSIGRFPMVNEVGRYELAKPVGDFMAYSIDNAYGNLECLKML